MRGKLVLLFWVSGLVLVSLCFGFLRDLVFGFVSIVLSLAGQSERGCESSEGIAQ